MQHAPAAGRSSPERAPGEEEQMRRTVKENAVVVVGRDGCCMVHVMRALLRSHGVIPKICVVGGEDAGAADEAPFLGGGGGHDFTTKREDSASGAEGGGACIIGKSGSPAVFIGGNLVGGLDRLMAVHISGELKPMLKQAGALWL